MVGVAPVACHNLPATRGIPATEARSHTDAEPARTMESAAGPPVALVVERTAVAAVLEPTFAKRRVVCMDYRCLLGVAETVRHYRVLAVVGVEQGVAGIVRAQVAGAASVEVLVPVVLALVAQLVAAAAAVGGICLPSHPLTRYHEGRGQCPRCLVS